MFYFERMFFGIANQWQKRFLGQDGEDENRCLCIFRSLPASVSGLCNLDALALDLTRFRVFFSSILCQNSEIYTLFCFARRHSINDFPFDSASRHRHFPRSPYALFGCRLQTNRACCSENSLRRRFFSRFSRRENSRNALYGSCGVASSHNDRLGKSPSLLRG